MKESVYEYRDYKKLFLDLIDNSEGGGRGVRKQLAEAINCQVSHITNVLGGAGHFAQEQAHEAGKFFGLNSDEIEFLLHLVQFNRAGTMGLRTFYERLLEEKQKKHSALKSRLRMPDAVKSEQEARYYSSWHFAAIHVLLSILQFQSREAVAKRLELPLSRVDEVLGFLVEMGLVAKSGQKYQITRAQLHLDKASPLISKHHTNWRLRTLLALDQKMDEQKTHYSSVVTLSMKDYQRVREILATALADALKVITQSPEEEVAVICLDFFRL